MRLIRTFVEHRLAANLGMALMVLAGVWAISELRVQLNPDQPRPYVNTQISWRGASAEDVEKLVTTPLEQQLKTIPDVRSVWSVTRDGSSFVEVEIEPDADVQDAVDRVKQGVSQIRSLPPDIEPPSIYALRQRDLVAAVLVTGSGSLDELIPLVREMENELLGRGIDAVEFVGLPTQEIAIQVDSRTLFELGLTFAELGAQLAALSTDSPGGTIGAGDLSRQLRSLDQRRDAAQFENLPVTTASGALVRLGDIAKVERRGLVDQPYMTVGGKPAIALFVRRDMESDSLEAASNLNAYLDAKRPTLPEGVSFNLFLEAWAFIRDELRLIVGNGLGGLAFVIVALVVFLRVGPAFWVTMGIPVTFLASLLGFYYLGGTINAISLIGFIMALGIVVDDAIVVGEEALSTGHRRPAARHGRYAACRGWRDALVRGLSLCTGGATTAQCQCRRAIRCLDVGRPPRWATVRRCRRQGFRPPRRGGNNGRNACAFAQVEFALRPLERALRAGLRRGRCGRQSTGRTLGSQRLARGGPASNQPSFRRGVSRAHRRDSFDAGRRQGTRRHRRRLRRFQESRGTPTAESRTHSRGVRHRRLNGPAGASAWLVPKHRNARFLRNRGGLMPPGQMTLSNSRAREFGCCRMSAPPHSRSGRSVAAEIAKPAPANYARGRSRNGGDG